MASKKFLYVNRKAPHGTYLCAGIARSGADRLPPSNRTVALAFIDDGVYQLMQNQDTSAIGSKNFSPTYRALGDYDVNQIYVEQESLELRGLSKEDLMPLTYEDEDDDWAEKDSIHVVSSAELADIIEQQDVILNF